MNNATIKDYYGKDYQVTNLEKFKKHIIDYHSIDGKGDNSLHEENGRYFRITDEFYSLIKNL
tara:strand:+ start:190 stop:375 length:186 start_codon:yes stop_codon:yes gene_type:complete